MGTKQAPGVCIWVTGRGGAGKSTLTRALIPLLEDAGHTITVLDVVPELRKHASERTSHGKLIRKAFVAREVARHGGVTICVTISSKQMIRDEARALVGPESFVEVYVKVPPEVSAARKAARPKKPALVKRVRRNARRMARQLGAARDRSFDVPVNPDVVVDSTIETPEVSARRVFDLLVERGFVARPLSG